MNKQNAGDPPHRRRLYPHPVTGVEVNHPRNLHIRIEVGENRLKSFDRKLTLKNVVDSFFFSSDVKTKKKRTRSSSSSSSSSTSSSSSSSSSSDEKTKRKKAKSKKSKAKKKKAKLKKQKKKEKKKKEKLKKKSKAAIAAAAAAAVAAAPPPAPPAVKPPVYPELWQSDEVEFGPGGEIRPTRLNSSC